MIDLRDSLERRSERLVLPLDALGRLFERGARRQRRRRTTAAVVALVIGAAGAVLAFSSIGGVGETPATSPANPQQTWAYRTGRRTRRSREQVVDDRAAGFTRRCPRSSTSRPDHRSAGGSQGPVIQDGFWSRRLETPTVRRRRAGEASSSSSVRIASKRPITLARSHTGTISLATRSPSA
jgi:hypothetical protein